jgi:hypothetical protein
MYSQSVSRRGVGGGCGGEDREHGENDVYNWQNILVDMSVYVCTCTGDKNMKK